MFTHEGKEAVRVNKYGEKEVVYKTRHGWRVKRTSTTPIIEINRAISAIVGENIKKQRIARGLTLKEVGIRCGMTGDPKGRMWAIENNTRGEGIRFGTLYMLSLVLDCEIQTLLPTKEQVVKETGLAGRTRVLSVA